MKEIILVKNGEIALKGLNRGTFEDVLIKNIKRRLKPLGIWDVSKAQSTLYFRPQSDNIDIDEACSRLSKVFGIAGYVRALCLPKDMNAILEQAPSYLKQKLSSAQTFKVEAKRADKRFPFPSPVICEELGGKLLESFPNLKVDVHNPEITVFCEIRDFDAFIHAGQTKGAGGMPLGTSGRGMLLLSGGIDSPVAGYMMAKRGLELAAVHFESPPYTSERAKRKVVDLAQILCEWCGRIDLFAVPFTEIQTEIRASCEQSMFTVIMRRFMMKLSCLLAKREGCGALITGESVAQVASQTLEAITCTDKAADIPVFRPVIGFDKEDIVQLSRKIGTFETSIQPFEDCCTVFTPRHPKIKPNLSEILAEEEKLNCDDLVRCALEGTELLQIRNSF